MYVKGLFEVFKVLGRIGIKPKDVIGMGGDIVKMGKSLFNTRVNPKLLIFIEKNQKIPPKILENIKLHARTLKNATENQKNLFLENIKSIQKAKTPKIPVKSQSPGTGIKQLETSAIPGKKAYTYVNAKGETRIMPSKKWMEGAKKAIKEGEDLPPDTDPFKGWTPKVIKGGKDKLAEGGRAKFEEGKGVNISPILDFSKTSSSPVEGIDVDVSDTTYGVEGIYQGDNLYAGGDYIKGKVKVNVQEEGNTVFEDSMSKDDMMQLYLGLGQKEGNHVEVGTDGQGNYTLNIIKSFAQGGIANHFRVR